METFVTIVIIIGVCLFSMFVLGCLGILSMFTSGIESLADIANQGTINKESKNDKK